jgi:predicted HTH transcriptional regulator
MLTPFDQLEPHLSRVDQSLMYHMILQQMETNRLLTQLLGQPTKEAAAVKIDELKRPELMKRIGKTKAPQGWQKWSNDKMIEYLKGDLE